MKYYKTFVLVAVFLIVVSCRESIQAPIRMTDVNELQVRGGRASSNKDQAPSAPDESGIVTKGMAAAQPARTRVVIKSGGLGFEVEKYDEATATLQKLVETWGGFISTSSTDIPYENVKRGTWVLRVPADKFDTAIAEIKKLAKKLENERIEGQDVTEEYYDLEARLKNKQLEEKQVQDILRRAGSISDVLEVQRELSRIRDEIERFEGRKKYLEDRVGLSTITVALHEPYPVSVSASGGFWATIGDGFGDGFRGFANVLSGTITFLIAGLPIFAILTLIIWMLVRAIKRARAKGAGVGPVK